MSFQPVPPPNQGHFRCALIRRRDLSWYSVESHNSEDLFSENDHPTRTLIMNHQDLTFQAMRNAFLHHRPGCAPHTMHGVTAPHRQTAAQSSPVKFLKWKSWTHPHNPASSVSAPACPGQRKVCTGQACSKAACSLFKHASRSNWGNECRHKEGHFKGSVWESEGGLSKACINLMPPTKPAVLECNERFLLQFQAFLEGSSCKQGPTVADGISKQHHQHCQSSGLTQLHSSSCHRPTGARCVWEPTGGPLRDARGKETSETRHVNMDDDAQTNG